jgi:hypothetical protein
LNLPVGNRSRLVIGRVIFLFGFVLHNPCISWFAYWS